MDLNFRHRLKLWEALFFSLQISHHRPTLGNFPSTKGCFYTNFAFTGPNTHFISSSLWFVFLSGNFLVTFLKKPAFWSPKITSAFLSVLPHIYIVQFPKHVHISLKMFLQHACVEGITAPGLHWGLLGAPQVHVLRAHPSSWDLRVHYHPAASASQPMPMPRTPQQIYSMQNP